MARASRDTATGLGNSGGPIPLQNGVPSENWVETFPDMVPAMGVSGKTKRSPSAAKGVCALTGDQYPSPRRYDLRTRGDAPTGGKGSQLVAVGSIKRLLVALGGIIRAAP